VIALSYLFWTLAKNALGKSTEQRNG
jgi:hypothetical protein